MTASEAFGAPLVRHGHKFHKLLMPEYGTLEATVRTLNVARFKEKVALLKTVLTPEQLSKLAAEARPYDVTPPDVDDYLRTSEGAAEALVASLGMGGVSEDVARKAVEKIPTVEASYLARVLIGFLPDDATKEDADPLPESPEPKA